MTWNGARRGGYQGTSPGRACAIVKWRNPTGDDEPRKHDNDGVAANVGRHHRWRCRESGDFEKDLPMKLG
jgi:hypothetical protein